MTRDETVALFLECEAKRVEARAAALAAGKDEYGADTTAHEAAKAHWNAWAEPLVAERNAMQAEGRWAVEKHPWGLESKSAETQAWFKKANADFSRCLFLLQEVVKEAAGEDKVANPEGEPPVKTIELEGKAIRFGGFVFPGDAGFRSAIFSGDAYFENATISGNTGFPSANFGGTAYFISANFSGDADFESAIFSGDAVFHSVAFTGYTNFQSATFESGAFFQSAAFSSEADFESANFTALADFESASFSGSAKFRTADFRADTSFRGTTFSDNAYFERAAFSGVTRLDIATFTRRTKFDGASFQKFTSFGGANFGGDANFLGIKVERSFNIAGAQYKAVPSFQQADFKQAPDLDDVSFPLPSFWRGGNPKLIPQYRAIRRMAIQGADYEREQMALKGEIRSKRRTEHKLNHGALWFGLAYDALSDFGRSIARPFWIGTASLLAFAAIYLWNAGVAFSEWGSACDGDGASKALKAATLSAANALPLIGSSRSEVATEFYTKCLALPHSPAWSPILQIWQTLWSAVLLFLFLLALRNQFKIK
jgi:hypothetical protein